MSCSNEFKPAFDYNKPCNGLPLDSQFSSSFNTNLSGGGASCSGVGFDLSNSIGGFPVVENYAPNCLEGGMRKRCKSKKRTKSKKYKRGKRHSARISSKSTVKRSTRRNKHSIRRNKRSKRRLLRTRK